MTPAPARKIVPPPPRPRHARRARLALAAAAGACVLLVAALLLLRATPRSYTPGLEAADSDEITSSLARPVPDGAPRVTFADSAGEAGITFTHFPAARSTQLPEDMGSGAAWGDYDGDGDPDLFLVNESAPLGDHSAPAPADGARSALYRNDGGGTFTDVTADAGILTQGLGMGAAWGDYDADADLDLVVTRFGTNLLYRNDGRKGFTEVSSQIGLSAAVGFWTGASWADYDRDGDLDLYVCGYVRYEPEPGDVRRTSLQYGAVIPYTLNPSSYPPERNLLYRNQRGIFAEVAAAAGVDNPTGRSLSAAWADFDNDGWPDLYVANDISDNAMYWNRGDGTFADVSHEAWVADHRGAMGLGIGDWENDGDLDIYITHWIAQENALYENLLERMPPTPTEPMRFIDNADTLGLGQIALDVIGWGTGFLDYDNDGRLDLLAVNGSTFQDEKDPSRLVPMKNHLFWNAGREGFYEVGAIAGDDFAQENVGRGAAFADYDADGDLDAAVIVNGGPARLLRNDGGNAKGWIRLVLRGSPPRAGGKQRPASRATTTFANGTRILLTAGGGTQIREVGAGSSYLSQDPPGEVHFGLGDARRVDRLEIRWPGGTVQTFEDLPAGIIVTLVEGGQPAIVSSTTEPTPADRGAAIRRFWSLYREATAMRTRGDFETAARLYEQTLQIDPNHEDCLYYYGQSLQERADYGGARAAFERLVEVNPASARGHLALGTLLTGAEVGAPFDLARAEEHLMRAHQINGEETAPMVRIGEILIMRGDMQGARHWLEAAARTNPKSAEAACLSGYLRWLAGDPAGASEFYAKAIRASQADKPVHGVLNEGDRKAPVPAATDAKTPAAAPPLKKPMGETLFGASCTDLPEEPASLDAVYRSIQAHSRALAARTSPP